MDKTPEVLQESKWVRLKEINIGPLLPCNAEETSILMPKRRFQPQKKIKSAAHTFSSKRTKAFSGGGGEDFVALYVRKGNKASSGAGGAVKRGIGNTSQSLYTQTILSEEGGQPIWSSSARGGGLYRSTKGTCIAVGGSTNTTIGNPSNTFVSSNSNTHLMARHNNSGTCNTNKLDPHAEASGKQSLLIEGSSLWNGDIALASQSLRNLSSCVKMERKLREQIEEAQNAKLQAFRFITNTFKKFVQNPSIRTHPEAKTIARCSVVTKTLTVIIQTFFRYFQSRQLIIGLQKKRECIRAHPPPPAIERTDVSPSPLCSVPSNRSDYDRASRSVEDLLDEEEINNIRQLYFDFYDCEVLSIDTPEMSNASEFGAFPPERGTSSSTSQSVLVSSTSI